MADVYLNSVTAAKMLGNAPKTQLAAPATIDRSTKAPAVSVAFGQDTFSTSRTTPKPPYDSSVRSTVSIDQLQSATPGTVANPDAGEEVAAAEEAKLTTRFASFDRVQSANPVKAVEPFDGSEVGQDGTEQIVD